MSEYTGKYDQGTPESATPECPPLGSSSLTEEEHREMFHRKHIRAGFIVDPKFATHTDFATGDILYKLTGYIYEKTLAKRTIRMTVPLPKPDGFGVYRKMPSVVSIYVTVKADEILGDPQVALGNIRAFQVGYARVPKMEDFV